MNKTRSVSIHFARFQSSLNLGWLISLSSHWHFHCYLLLSIAVKKGLRANVNSLNSFRRPCVAHSDEMAHGGPASLKTAQVIT